MRKSIQLLKKNGFKKTDSGIYANEIVGITINTKEYSVCNSHGDVEYLPSNYYSILGYLIDKRIIGLNYKR